MGLAHKTGEEDEKPAFKVGVSLTAEQHRRFKGQCAFNGETMHMVLMRAVEDYCKTRVRPPLSKKQKEEDRRVKAITKLITERAAEFIEPGERITATKLFERIKLASNTETKPSLEDVIFLGKDRLKNMLNQKSGTGRRFRPNESGLTFELRGPDAQHTEQKTAAKPKTPRRRSGV